MIEIVPINCGVLGFAKFVYVVVTNFPTSADTCMLLYYVYNEDRVVLIDKQYELTPEQFANWGTDNTYVENIILNLIGATRA